MTAPLFMPALPGLGLRPGNIGQPHQPHPTPSKSRARTIGAETWQLERSRIHELYITDDQTLLQVMDHYEKKYGFKATKKQWKDQLAKWQYRKRLNPQDAAYIASQLRDGERQGVNRRVLFNGNPKTMADIHAYIRKSDKIHSETALMGYLDRDTVSPHISVEDVPAEVEPYFDFNEALDQVRSVSTPDISATSPLAGEKEDENKRLSEDSFEEFLNPELEQLDLSYFDTKSLDDEPMAMDVNDSVLPEERSFFDSDSSFDVPTVYTDLVDGSAGPMAQLGRSSHLNSVLSSSAIQTRLTPFELDAKVDEWMGSGKHSLLGENTESQQRVLNFLRHCCAAAVHSRQEGDGFSEYSTAAIQKAVTAFHAILDAHPWDSLSILNNMFVLLAMYGHHYVNIKILKTLMIDVHDAVKRAESPPRFMLVLWTVLDFMSQIPYAPDTDPEYDLDELADMVRSAEQCFQTEPHDQFKLSARYMYAWALLEMEEYHKALQILKDLKDDCEEVFGFGQFQTIHSIATLARAQAMVGKRLLAANIYRDLVTSRIRRFFSPKHPQYWDAEYRLACYDRRWIDDLKDEQQKRAKWLDVARRMHEPLKWREQFLGPMCPITLQNFRALVGVLKKLDLANDDTTLPEVLVMTLSS